MVQTNFTAGDSASLASVLLDISSGTDAATNTAYTVTMTQAILAPSETVRPQSGSTVTLEGSFPFIIDAFAVTGSLIADLNFTGTITLDNGFFENVATAVNGGGTVIAGLYTGAVLGSVGDNGDVVINDGAIEYTGTYAAVELASGTVENGWNGPATALISGVTGGVLLEASGLVENDGSIIATAATTTAVFMAAGTVENGQIGDVNARLAGGENGVEITGAGVVNNDGTILGQNSDAVYLGSGTVTNGQLGDTTASISGGSADNGVWIDTGSGTVDNFGTITGGGASGVLLKAGGSVTNGASTDVLATITGAYEGVLIAAAGALFNNGTVEADGSDASRSVIGAFLEDGGAISNATTAALIKGLEWGAIIEGAPGTVTNLGLIQALAAAGLGLDLTAGGTIVNGLSPRSGATISGQFDGVRISAGAAGAGALVRNDGTISGTVGVDFKSGPTPAAGTLINDGLIASSTGVDGFAAVFGDGAETLVLQPAGAFLGHVLGDNAAGASTVLELAAGTQGTLSATAADGGTVTDGAGSFAFSAIGTVSVDAGASWIVTSPGTLDTVFNAGSLGISGGPVTISGSASVSGALSIAGATLTAASGVLTDSGIIALGAGGVLDVAGGGIVSAGTPDLQIDGDTNAVLDVSGAGALVNSPQRIEIGTNGQATALIDQGGSVAVATPFAADAAIDLGGASGASGALTISDPGSRLSATGQLTVGLSGDGSLLLENQATVVAGGNPVDPTEGVDIGQSPGGSGQATVSGAMSLLSDNGRFVVGDAGLGVLLIEAGGTVTTTPAAGLAGAVIASAAGASGSAVNVTGTGSNWQVTGSLIVGAAGAGSLSLTQGASVTAAALDEASIATGSGQIGIVGAGSDLSVAGTATVADQSAATLSILNGGSFQAAFLNLGMGSATGALTVGGPGTDFHITNDMTVGHNGVFSIGNNVTVFINGNFDEIGAVNQGDGSLIDPSTVTNSSPHGGGGGSQILASGSITNNSTYFVGDNNNGSYILTTPLITGTGVLQADPASNAGAEPDLVLNTDGIGSGQTLVFGGQPAEITLGSDKGTMAIAGLAAGINGFVAGDTLAVTTTVAAGFQLSGSVVSVVDNVGGATEGSLVFASAALASTAFNTSGALVDQVACFAAGTRIETDHGMVAVEYLRVGDRVLTHDGAIEPIVWIGQRTLDCARHPKPEKIWPVWIAAGAFATNVPTRDLYLSPDHAIHIDDVLVPVKLLRNGTTIAQTPCSRITYFHVELPCHAVILAEGLTVESYLDSGDRADFTNTATTIRLRPEVAPARARSLTWETRAAAPIAMTGALLAAARRVLNKQRRHSINTDAMAAR